MLTKPCLRPGCTGTVSKTLTARFTVTQYCSRACSARHRVDRDGGHPFLRRTPEEIQRTAERGGRTRAEQAKRRRMVVIGLKVDKHITAEMRLRMGARDLALVKVLCVRFYSEGKADGYKLGHRQGARMTKTEAA